MIYRDLIDELDAYKPRQFDRQTWVNTLLDIACRIKMFVETPTKQTAHVEFPSSIGVFSGAGNSSVIYLSKEREENKTTTNNYYYGINPIVEPTTGQPEQKKEQGEITLEKTAEQILEQLRLEEVNRPLNAKAKEMAENIKELDQKLHKDAFEAFWRLYQSCPAPDLRVASQSKTKAKEQYRLTLKTTPHQKLLEATEKAVDKQMQAQRRQEWIAPLPDAFRWLRDGRFQVWLDPIEERQQKKGDWL